MKKYTTPISVGNRQSANFWKVFAITAILFSTAINSANIYGQAGQKYAVDLNNLSNGDGFGSRNNFPIVFYTNNIPWMWLTTSGSLGLGVSNPFHRFEVDGNSRFFGSVYVDSFLTALEIQTGNLTTGGLLVTGNSQLNGLLNIGSLLLIDGTGSFITSSSGFLGFGNNSLTTTGNISADSITADVISVTRFLTVPRLDADSINANYLSANGIDAGQYLLNGLQLESSQWTSSGSNIFYNQGNVGIGTDDPQKALHLLTVHDIPFSLPPPIPVPPPLGGTHYGIRLEDHTTTHLGTKNLGTTITIWDLEPRGGNLIMGTPGAPKLTLTGSGTYLFHGLADLTTPIVQYRPVVVDHIGELTVLPPGGALQTLDVVNATFDSLRVNHIIRVGTNTLVLDGSTTQTGPANSIYSSGGDLKIQSTGTDFNTIVSDGNNSFVGIGTTSPSKKLHVKTEHTFLLEPCLPCHLLIPIPPDCPLPLEELSHGGIRIEDETIFEVCTNQVNSISTIWDIEPQFGSLVIGTPAVFPNPLTATNPYLVLGPTGNIGIGTTSPVDKLDVDGTVRIRDGWRGLKIHGVSDGAHDYHFIVGCVGDGSADCNNGIAGDVSREGGFAIYDDTEQQYRFVIDRNGNVGIDVLDPDDNYRLSVCGTIRSKEWVVDPAGWCDYALKPGYQKMPWKKKKEIYEAQGYMPYMDSGAEIEKNGLKAGKNLKGMMLNLEEDRLDITELFEKYERMEMKVEKLEKENKELKRKIEMLEKK